MSHSDSSSEQLDIEIPEVQRPQYKQILQKGKSIAPWMTNENLIRMYKRYYSVDHVFFHQLEIEVKKRNMGNEGKQQQWIFTGKTANKNRERKRYNFLEDHQLLNRIYNQGKQSKHRENTADDTKTQQKKKVSFIVPDQHKNKKYKEKETQNPTKSQYKEKTSHYVEKKEQNHSNSEIDNRKQVTSNDSQQNKKVSNNQSQKKQKFKPKQESQNKSKQAPKYAPKQPQNQPSKEKQASGKKKYGEKKVQSYPITSTKTNQKAKYIQKSFEEPPIATIYNEKESLARFQQQCNKNSLILKFLKPNLEKKQIVTYILKKGSTQPSEVSTRLVLK